MNTPLSSHHAGLASSHAPPSHHALLESTTQAAGWPFRDDHVGVLGAMETGYQRGKIQEESLYYEHKKHDGSYPIIGVNTFRNPKGDAQIEIEIELARSTEEEKQSQITRLRDFQSRNAAESGAMAERLKQTVIDNGNVNVNVFAVLVDAVRVCSLGQITSALYEVGGPYRRSMWFLVLLFRRGLSGNGESVFYPELLAARGQDGC